MNFSKQAGFTLIELLVVISIIGILSATVLAGLDQAKQSAKDTAIKQEIKSLIIIMELTRNTNNSYLDHQLGWFVLDAVATETDCANAPFTGPYATDIRKICQSIEDKISHQGIFGFGSYMYWGTEGVLDSNNNYSFMVMLNSGDMYCIGSSGRSWSGDLFSYIGAEGCRFNP